MPIATEPERTLTEAGLSITNQSRLSYALLVFNHSYNGSFVIHSWHTSSFSLHHFGMDWSGHPSRNNQQKESLLVIMTTATSQRLPICVGVLLGHCAIKLNAYFEKSFHSHAHLCANLWKGHSLSRLASLFEFWRMVVSSECLVVFFFVFFVFGFFLHLIVKEEISQLALLVLSFVGFAFITIFWLPVSLENLWFSPPKYCTYCTGLLSLSDCKR